MTDESNLELDVLITLYERRTLICQSGSFNFLTQHTKYFCMLTVMFLSRSAQLDSKLSHIRSVRVNKYRGKHKTWPA